MVLPGTEHSLRQEERRLIRLNKRKVFDDEDIEKWKALVWKAALSSSGRLQGNEKQEKVVLRKNKGGVLRPTTSIGEEPSTRSVERAMARGTQLGYSEENEKAPPNGVQYFHRGSEDLTFPTNDLSTLCSIEESHDEQAVGVQSKKKKEGWGQRRRRKRNEKIRKSKRNPLGGQKMRNKGNDSNDITKEAWMCGCCGKVFATFQEADAHEIDCIQRVIQKTQHSESSSVDFMEDNESQLRNEGDSYDVSWQEPNPPIPEVSDRTLAPGSILDKDYEEEDDYERQQPIDNDLLKDIGLLDDNEPISSAFDNLAQKKETPLCCGRSDNASVQLQTATEKRTRVRFGSVKQIPAEQVMEQVSINTQLRGSEGDILLTQSMKQSITMTDEALVETVQRATSHVLTDSEREAEQHLKYLANDKIYYESMDERASMLKAHPRRRFKTDGTSLKDKIQNKFVDAWQLIKEGDAENTQEDQYEKKNRRRQKTTVDDKDDLLVHDRRTHYINVAVNHSRTVVQTELEHRAMKRWTKNYSDKSGNFEQVRKLAHVGIVKLAKLAVMADFTPRNVAVQLSNNLYRLISPALKRRGVLIKTEIEYRVGPYFVLAVNINSIHWAKLIKYSHKLVERRREEWKNDQIRRDNLNEEVQETTDHSHSLCSRLHSQWCYVCSMRNNEIIANFLYCVHYLPWSVSSPICWVLFHWIIPLIIRQYILEGVADEIFSFVEGKGMEMAIQVMPPDKQTAFMLSALRELREGSNEEKKKTGDEKDINGILGNLLGKTIKADLEPPPDLSGIPDHLEFVNLEMDLPVGFQRLRWALLSKESTFTEDVVYAEAKYTEIVLKDWSKHDDVIGLPSESMPLDGPTEEDIVGAEIEREYLMPKSTFVKANTVSQTTQIKNYNDSCVCIQLRTLTPEVPYGNTFVTWTQILITNTGHNSCHMVCSVEVEFPNGQPMISRQIISGARSGTASYFVLLSEAIIKYANEYL